MYGRVEEYFLDDLPDILLEHKVEMCRLLLQVLDVVEPGYSRSRGTNKKLILDNLKAVSNSI